MDLQDMFSLKDKVAIVSGASGALGGAAVRAMLLAGATVVACCHRHRERLEALLERLPDAPSATISVLDAFSPEAVREHAHDVMRQHGHIDIVINVAGGNTPGAYFTEEQTLFDLDWKALSDTVTLNLFGGCLWPCIAYGACMRDNPHGGAIINFSSISAFRAVNGHIAYAAAKAGVSSVTRSLAAHLAHDVNPRLRVNAVAPGFFPNNNPAQMLFAEDGSYRPKARRSVDATPMGRMGSPDELMGTLIWLASDASSFVTGQTITVDGGYLAHSPA